MNIYPPFAVLKFPRKLPKQPLRVARTVIPDKVLDPTKWVLWHRLNNKVVITLADRNERRNP